MKQGRPPKPEKEIRQVITLRVSPELYAYLKQLENRTEFIEAAIEKQVKQLKGKAS